jgi:hypothetical protein
MTKLSMGCGAIGKDIPVAESSAAVLTFYELCPLKYTFIETKYRENCFS